jgi:hypothetical protein
VFEALTAAQANQVTALLVCPAAKVALCRAIVVAAYQAEAAALCRVTAALVLRATVAAVMIQQAVATASAFVAQGKCRKSEWLSPK